MTCRRNRLNEREHARGASTNGHGFRQTRKDAVTTLVSGPFANSSTFSKPGSSSTQWDSSKLTYKSEADLERTLSKNTVKHVVHGVWL